MTEEVVWVPPRSTPDKPPGQPLSNPFTLALVWIWIVTLAIGLVLLLTGALETQNYSEGYGPDGSATLIAGAFFAATGIAALLAWISVKAVAWHIKNLEL